MQFIRTVWFRVRRPGRAQVAQRAARVIDKAMFDVGIDNFLNGTVTLDARLRPRFFSATTARQHTGVATVVLSGLAEARALQTLACTFDLTAHDRQERCAAVLNGVMREFHAQSPAFRALR